VTDAWVSLNLASAVQLGGGTYSGGEVYGSGGIFPDFYFPGLTLDPTLFYEFEVTFNPASVHDTGVRDFWVSPADPADVPGEYVTNAYPFGAIYNDADVDYPHNPVTGSPDLVQVLGGPGRGAWTGNVDSGLTAPIFGFNPGSAITGLRYRVVTFTSTSGTSSTTNDGTWQVTFDATGLPTVVGTLPTDPGLQVFANTSDFTNGVGYTLVNPVTVPVDATIDNVSVTMSVESNGQSIDNVVHVSPLCGFSPLSTAGPTISFTSFVGAGGPGDLPLSGGKQTITYDGLTYPALSGGAGVGDFNAWVAAANNTADQMIMTCTVQNANNGGYLKYYNPVVFDVAWTVIAVDPGPDDPATGVTGFDTSRALAALRQYPRSDGLGASSARRVWPPAPSVQAFNRRAGGYL